MNSEELHNRLQASERKRSLLVVELGHARLELQAATLEVNALREEATDARNGSPSRGNVADESSAMAVSQLKERLARSERERVQLTKRLVGAHQNADAASGITTGTGIGVGGTMSIASVEEANDADFAFSEEEEARAAAEELMAQLLHLKRSLHLTKTELSEVRMELTEQVSEHDAGKVREVALGQLVDQYQAQVQQLLALQQAKEVEGPPHNNSSLIGDDATQNMTGGPGQPKLVLGGKLTETQVRDLEKRQFDLSEALERLQEELLVEQCRRKTAEDELQRLRAFVSSGGAGDANLAAALDPRKGGGDPGVEAELRRQVEALTGTYTKQLDYCKVQDDLIKKLRAALKDKIDRVRELETLVRAQLQSSHGPNFH